MYYLTLNSTEFRQSSQIRGGGGGALFGSRRKMYGGAVRYFFWLQRLFASTSNVNEPFNV